MNVTLITPSLAPDGNLITARRYSRILRAAGHRVRIQTVWDKQSCDLMIALHARKSHPSIVEFRQRYPNSSLVVVLTGTDLYRDLKSKGNTVESLELATRIVLLQAQASDDIPARFRCKTRVIYQSAEPISGIDRPTSYFRLALIGHLRAEKDPLRCAYAVRQLPDWSRVKLLHAGRAMDSRIERAVTREEQTNPRYRWLGELPHWKSRRLIAGSHLLVLTSKMEGSSNALSEALAASVPCIASAIPGLIGTLGRDYPGYFKVGDTAALTNLIIRAESDSNFYNLIASYCRRLRPLVSPEREHDCWKRLIDELPG